MQPPRTWFIGLSGCEKEREVDILNYHFSKEIQICKASNNLHN